MHLWFLPTGRKHFPHWATGSAVAAKLDLGVIVIFSSQDNMATVLKKIGYCSDDWDCAYQL